MGFQFDPVTPLAPWANGTVDRFMPNLTKVLQTAKEEGHNWRQELQRYLRAYQSTPHSSTGFSPAYLLFNGRKYKTRPPNDLRKTILVTKKQVQPNDQCAKRKMKEHADRKSYVAPINLKEGDLVLCRQSKVNKLTTPFNSQPFRVVKVRGNRVTAVADGRYITRHITFFKPLKHEVDIHSSYYDLSPASEDVNTTPLSPAQLSEQTSVVQPDGSAKTSSQGTVTDAKQDTETEQDPIIISAQRQRPVRRAK